MHRADRRGTMAIADVDRLVQDGDAVAALDALVALVALNRAYPSSELQVRLIELRREAAEAYGPAGRWPWPPMFEDPFPEVVGRPPAIAARARRVYSGVLPSRTTAASSWGDLFDHDAL